jgi:hypothetical protein
MGRIATLTSPSVRWRLPTLSDWQQAHLDGLANVLPNLGAPADYSSDGSGGTEITYFLDGHSC